KAKADTDLKQYDHVIYVLDLGCAGAGGGLGQMGGKRIWMAYNPKYDTLSDEFGYRATHEIGHNLGLEHAHSYICTDGLANPDHGRPAIRVVLHNPDGACTTNDYGDPFDVMGPHWLGRQNGLFHKLELGVPMLVPTITTDGDYGFDAIEYPSSWAKGLRIEIPW